MTPYLAVIKDSFREAFASWMLWILIGVVTLILLAIAPLDLVERAAFQVHPQEIKNPRQFLEALAERGGGNEPSPWQHVWQQLPARLKETLSRPYRTLEGFERRRLVGDLTTELSKLLKSPDFYDKDAWDSVVLSTATKEFLARPLDSLNEDELARRNRLLFDDAFNEFVNESASTAIHVVYAFYESDAILLPASQVPEVVRWAVWGIVTFVVGVGGILAAIVVTASIVPQTFEQGAIDLLLSKPVSRSLIFLTKFMGGCAFILLVSTYFMVGLWLIVGWRYDLWMHGVLKSIPVFLFCFAIFYSVSSLAGVIWKNAIVSIVVTILFWGTCLAVGLAKSFVLEGIFLNNRQATVALATNDSVIITNRVGKTFEWQADTNAWEEIFTRPQSGPMGFDLPFPLLGPVYDSKTDRIMAVALPFQRPGRRNNPFGGGTGNIVVGTGEDHWKRKSGVAIPRGISAMFLDSNKKIVVAGVGGIHRFTGDPGVEHVPFKVFGFDIGRTEDAGQFIDLSPPVASTWSDPLSVAFDQDSNDIAVYTNDNLSVLSIEGTEDSEEVYYKVTASTDLEDHGAAIVGIAGGTVVVAHEDSKLTVLNAKTLKPTDDDFDLDDEAPRTIISSPNDATFAILTHSNNLWLFDATTKKLSQPGIAGQGNISAVTIDSESLMVADRYPRITRYSLEDLSIQGQMSPESDVPEIIYRWIVMPLYTIFPKPNELDDLTSYLMTEQRSILVEDEAAGLEADRVMFNIWQPVWSSLAFTVVILFFGCVYVARKDF